MSDAPSEGVKPASRRWPGRLLVLALIATTIGVFFALDGPHKLTWDEFQEQRATLADWVQANFLLAVLLYFVLYVVVTAVSLPGATVMTLVGGFLFGRWLGTLLVSFASTSGATLAFLSTRYLLRDFIQQRWGQWLAPINRGVEKDGAYYLLTLRLVPAFPFFVVNAVMGLTPLRVTTYWWVSQLGMLPATFLYVNAGTELGQIAQPKDILSPTVVLSLVLLGVVPLALRKALQWRQRTNPAPRDAG